MKAQKVTAVILTNDNGQVEDIYFLQESAGVFLAVKYEFADGDSAEDQKTREEIDEAILAVRDANLPEKGTPADAHYCYVHAIASGLATTEEQVAKEIQDDAQEPLPSFALCCVVRGGRHGLRLAFSQEAANRIFDDLGADPMAGMTREQVAFARMVICEQKLPFPANRVQLDARLDAMLRSLTQTHR